MFRYRMRHGVGREGIKKRRGELVIKEKRKRLRELEMGWKDEGNRKDIDKGEAWKKRGKGRERVGEKGGKKSNGGRERNGESREEKFGMKWLA